MPAEIRVPEMGESIVEATVGRWLKRQGEQVSAGDAVVELETEKVNLEISAEQDGVLQDVRKQEGDVVRVGDVLAVVSEAAAAPSFAPMPPASAAGASPSRRLSPVAGEVEGGGTRVTPLARQRAAEYGVDLGRVQGTGVGGRITQEDVERAAAAAGGAPSMGTGGPPVAPSPQPIAAFRPPEPTPIRPTAGPQPGVRQPDVAQPSPAVSERPSSIRGAGTGGAPTPSVIAPDERHEERQRLTRRRQTIARRLSEAHLTAVMTTTYNEVDMTAVMDLRKRRRERFKERYGVDLGFMSFFVKASVAALKAFPVLNAELDGDELVQKYYYDIGIAIGAEEGLVVPALRDADKKSFAEIEAAIRDMAARTRERKLTLEELQAGTFTITNGGVFGSLFSTPILNPPQVGILGMHNIVQRPAVVDGQIAVRPMMYLALTYDHRAVDGGTAVRFLVRITELIEDPAQLLLEG